MSRRSASVRGATIVITGAASGMGELYARRAASEGAAKIALLDVNGDAAERIARELTSETTRAYAFAVNLGDRDACVGVAAEVLAGVGAPDILINNAGIVRGAPFWEHDPERDIDATMRVNTLAPMWLTRELLPEMMRGSRPRRILNIASAAATLANPNMSVYAASKWALTGWSESLRLELARAGVSNFAVTTFCPSFVSTGMFDGARGPLLTPIMTPQQAVDAAWRGMLAGTPVVMKPWTVKLGMALRGALPTRAWDAIAGNVFKVYSSMDEFVGRGQES